MDSKKSFCNAGKENAFHFDDTYELHSILSEMTSLMKFLFYSVKMPCAAPEERSLSN